jgi:hypothetical protein
VAERAVPLEDLHSFHGAPEDIHAGARVRLLDNVASLDRDIERKEALASLNLTFDRKSSLVGSSFAFDERYLSRTRQASEKPHRGRTSLSTDRG